jgi:hypothetical protein
LNHDWTRPAIDLAPSRARMRPHAS